MIETITRNYMLYKSKAEFTDYAMNHVVGCSHNCQYPCAAYFQAKRFGRIEDTSQWCNPKIVANTLSLLEAEIPALKNKIESVFLSPATDPFMYGNKKVECLTLSVLRRLNREGIKCKVLTKGILPELLINLHPMNEYGISLVSLDENYRQKMEPNTAPLRERLQALKNLHDKYLNTWVAIEPYPTPNIIEQDLNELLEAVSFVDRIIFGRTNYSTEVTSFKHHRNFYNDCVKKVLKFCMLNGIDCNIRRGTVA